MGVQGAMARVEIKGNAPEAEACDKLNTLKKDNRALSSSMQEKECYTAQHASSCMHWKGFASNLQNCSGCAPEKTWPPGER